MIKMLTVLFLSLFFTVIVSATDITYDSQASQTENIMTQKEKEQRNRAARIAKEREKPTSRFKQKAYQRAAQRELHQQEIKERQLQNASRFQKEAIDEEQSRIDELKGLAASNVDNKSRFTLKAEERAHNRVLKEQEKLERKKRRRRNKN